ncbi:MAG: prepilin peptidase [Methylotenera sp.]|nr:prepilin peptidase [Methylotenera sp.]
MVNSSYVLLMLAGVIMLSIAVSLSDYQSRKIPNRYLLMAMAYAFCIIVYFSLAQGWLFFGMALRNGLFGMLIGFALLIPGYFLKQVAAGDVKLMMVFGFYLGPLGATLSLVIGAMIGGLWALAIAWRQGGLGNLFRNIKYMWNSMWLSGFKEMTWDLRSDGAIKMPYGVALSAGAVLVSSWQLWIRFFAN